MLLAAGKGTRMGSDLPKVCHPVGGRPMVCAVVDACLEAGCERIVAVVGYRQELVREALAEYGRTVEFAVQGEQLGTGHAVMCAEPAFLAEMRDNTDLFVLCGDGPLIRTETLRVMLDRHRESGAAGTLATSIIDNPDGYGRIVRDGAGGGGRFQRIVEQKNATADELKIREINPSYYCFNTRALFEALAGVGRNPLTGEYYITDVFERLLDQGEVVEVIDAVPPEDVLSINTPEHLAEVDRIFRGRVRGAAAGGAIGTSGSDA
jgi:bifunctional UDP-N-acetylglucosamine pyrophosphorylase/glucosamine-1-phosphate N-acetyltransferase